MLELLVDWLSPLSSSDQSYTNVLDNKSIWFKQFYLYLISQLFPQDVHFIEFPWKRLIIILTMLFIVKFYGYLLKKFRHS